MQTARFYQNDEFFTFIVIDTLEQSIQRVHARKRVIKIRRSLLQYAGDLQIMKHIHRKQVWYLICSLNA